MFGLIVFIICIAVSVYIYKQTASRLRKKGRGKLSTLLISLTCSVFAFMVSVAVGSSLIGTSHQEKNIVQNNNQIVREVKNKTVQVSSKKDEVVLNEQAMKAAQVFFDYLEPTDINMSIQYYELNNKITSLLKSDQGIKIPYTNRKDLFAYTLSDGTKMMVIVDKAAGNVNYIGMMKNTDGNKILMKSFAENQALLVDSLQPSSNIDSALNFLGELASNGKGNHEGNTFSFVSKNGVLMTSIRHQ